LSKRLSSAGIGSTNPGFRYLARRGCAHRNPGPTRTRSCLLPFVFGTVIAALAFFLPSADAYPQSAGLATIIKAISYGAVCDGKFRSASTGGSVDYVAIQDAVLAAEKTAGGATVLLPPGTCVLSQNVQLERPTAIVLEGATSTSGSTLTTVIDTINPKNAAGDVKVTSDGNTVQDLTLDQTSYGQAIYVQANNTSVQRMTILGGTGSFAAYFTGDGTTARSEGNRLLNSTVVSLINHLVPIPDGHPCGDGLVWAQQDSSLVQNVNFTGTRLALYQDTNTTVDGYTYHPGPQICDLDGFYITQPSTAISLSNLTMYGSGGVISNRSTTNGISSNITISNEQVLAPTPGKGFTLNGASHGLFIRDANGVKINNSNFDSGQQANSSIEFQPSTSTRGVVVTGSTVPRISFWGATATSSTPAATSQGEFDSDTFAAYTWPDNHTDTFLNGSGSPAAFTISGGTFSNYQPNDLPYYGLFHGSNSTFTVHDLAGYPGPTSVTVP
jgi:hypothetical protein